MDERKRLQEAADLAMQYQSAINSGDLDKAWEMVLPKEREAVDKVSFIKEKLGMDTIIENVRKFHPDIGTLTPGEAVFDEKTNKYRVSITERYPDAAMISPIFAEVMQDFFGLSSEEFDQQKYKKKVGKAIAKNRKIFKNGQLLDVTITEDVEEYEGTLFISPGWIEQIREAEEKRAQQEKAKALSMEVFTEQGYNGSIFKALELYRELLQLDETYAQKYADIEERAAIAPKISVEIIPSDMESKGMEKVRVTNNSDKPVASVNCRCELFDENDKNIYSEIIQIYQSVAPGASAESWAMFDSEAGAKRKRVTLEVVNVTLT